LDREALPRMVRLSLLSLGLVLAVGGCGGWDDSNTKSEGLEALEAARAKARAARYLVVLDDGGQRLRFVPGLTEISKDGRVLLWARRDVEYTLRNDRRCYQRHTEFERADLVEVRRDLVVPQADDAELAEAGGRALIRWRYRPSEDGHWREGRLYLDRSRHPVLSRERESTFGGQPPGRWLERRYRYPSELELDRPPGPRCRASGSGLTPRRR
jgi:hypothetical protein